MMTLHLDTLALIIFKTSFLFKKDCLILSLNIIYDYCANFEAQNYHLNGDFLTLERNLICGGMLKIYRKPLN